MSGNARREERRSAYEGGEKRTGGENGKSRVGEAQGSVESGVKGKAWEKPGWDAGEKAGATWIKRKREKTKRASR